VSLAPIWIALAVLAARDGCDSNAPATAGSGSGSGSSVATPTLAPAVAPPAGSAAPTTTTMSKDAQVKLDKLVGAKPGSHKPIKPTPEPSSGTGSNSGSAAPKPAKNRNAYPQYGRAMSESEMMDIPDMDRHQESFSYGAVVREGYSTVPHYIAFRCIQKPNCGDWAHMGSDWKAVGWWGAVF
jgi:hypothetical protein